MNMTGEVEGSNCRRVSVAWNFFKKLNQKHARCNHCDGIFLYETTLSHLLKHVKKQHPDAFLQLKNQEEKKKLEEITSSVPNMDESSWPAVEVVLPSDDSKSRDKKLDEDLSSNIWSSFTKIDDSSAECNLCQITLPCKDSVSDLIEHREVEHSGVLLKNSPEKEPSRNGLCGMPLLNGKRSLASHSSKDSKPAGKTSEPILNMKFRTSPSWQYFTLIDKRHARCKFCRVVLSHQSCSNLMRHVLRKHPCEMLAWSFNGKIRDEEKNIDENSADSSTLDPQNQSDAEDDSEVEASEEVNKAGKNSSDVSDSDKTYELRHSKRQKTEHPLEEEDQAMNDELDIVSTDPDFQTSYDQNSISKDNRASDEEKRSKPRSCVWQHYTRLKNGCLRCKICLNTLSKKSQVSNLKRHLRRTHGMLGFPMQWKSNANENDIRKELPKETVDSRPIIHTFRRGTQSYSIHLEQGTNQQRETASKQLADATEKQNGGVSPRGSQALRKNYSISSVAHGTGCCLLSERLVKAVEEGNNLLRSLQSAVERQGEALERFVTCLEGMRQVQNNNE